MTTSSDEEELCGVCGQPDQPFHKTSQHPFTPEGKEWAPPRDQTRPKPSERREHKASGSSMGGTQVLRIMPQPDLGLRAVLINRGLITMEDLREADDALRIPHPNPATVRADEAGTGGDGADRSPARPE